LRRWATGGGRWFCSMTARATWSALFRERSKIGRRQSPPRFVVLRDNDGGDCKTLKARLLTLTPRRVVARVKIRIVMQELESWYLGDLDALWRAGLIAREVAEAQRRKAILKNPDAIQNAKIFLKTKIVAGGQIELARRIGPHLKIADNRSRSFHAFVGALRWAAGESDSP